MSQDKKGLKRTLPWIFASLILASSLGMLGWRHHTTQLAQTTLQLPSDTHKDSSITAAQAPHWKTMTAHHGDSLATMFHRNHLKSADLFALLKLKDAKQYLPNIKPGQKIHYQIDLQDHVTALDFPINELTRLVVTEKQQHYISKLHKQPLTSALLYKSGTVHTSFAAAARRAGLTHQMYATLGSIFAGSINFNRDIRPGDHFSVLYREYFLNGKKYKPGEIVVAAFTNRGKTYKAIHYHYPKGHDGYFTPNGHGVEPLFLRAPLHYKRISSYFSYHRMDPYIHKIRPHLGVDFAANVGTPIHSIGDGTVEFCGRDDGYGNAVIIRYGRHYKALYGHMEHFALNLHEHEYVHKGQVIGYVGDTGWSTGPHLHFGLFVNGVAKNPLKLKFPGGKPVPASRMPHYLAYAKDMLAEMNLYAGPEFAENTLTLKKSKKTTE